ncbi:hypothetical protein B9Z19DRAFT_720376 [Tuber borchii]|uniref:Uncharacterized protein n=1 Tax=Tuber borchii TaxID=42251 RepID=A0A2T6ZYL8_TUBBO|nr:hypothetical protein B9Z19DRAFT_720376 [Tuber borchii]
MTGLFEAPVLIPPTTTSYLYIVETTNPSHEYHYSRRFLSTNHLIRGYYYQRQEACHAAARIIRQAFDIAIQNGKTDESHFYGPYNILLSYLFPLGEKYVVVPQCKKPTELKSADFTTTFVVNHKHHPAFFAEIKSSESLQCAGSCEQADLQMRERFGHLFEDVEISTLYGASAMGTKICMYKLDRASRRLSPTLIPRNPNFIINTAPINRWDLDIMTPEGEEEFCKVVQEIKKMSCRL